MILESSPAIDHGKTTALLYEAAARIGLPDGAVEKIVVAGREEYNDWVGTLSGNRGWYSDLSHDFIAGKTVRRAGQAGSSIVLRENVVETALDDPGPDGDLYRYAIGFQLGRAKDMFLRPVEQPEQLDPDGEEFSVEGWANLWGSLLIDEFFAASHSAPLIAEGFRERLVGLKREAFAAHQESELDSLIRWKKKRIRDGQFKIAVATAYWRMLIEQAHLAGGLGMYCPAILEIEDKLFSYLQPDGSRAGQMRTLTETWRTLAREFGGYEFREVEGADRIFFRGEQLC